MRYVETERDTVAGPRAGVSETLQTGVSETSDTLSTRTAENTGYCPEPQDRGAKSLAQDKHGSPV